MAEKNFTLKTWGRSGEVGNLCKELLQTKQSFTKTTTQNVFYAL